MMHINNDIQYGASEQLVNGYERSVERFRLSLSLAIPPTISRLVFIQNTKRLLPLCSRQVTVVVLHGGVYGWRPGKARWEVVEEVGEGEVGGRTEARGRRGV